MLLRAFTIELFLTTWTAAPQADRTILASSASRALHGARFRFPHLTPSAVRILPLARAATRSRSTSRTASAWSTPSK